jgi:dTDP-4-amino-4,6-dideoxygalactose transaminase
VFKIPFLGVGHRLDDEDIDCLKEVARNAKTYTQGEYQELFERQFRVFINQENGRCLAVTNAASAIELVADDVALEVGDEIVCTSHTYAATLYPFLRKGIRVRWADIDRESWLSESEQIESKISQKTKLVIVVHLYGLPSRCYESYEEWRAKGITIIEDCAQALGSRIDNRHVGTQSDYGVFSFQSHKNISTLGEGGMLVVRNEERIECIKRNRHNGHCAYQVYTQEYWKPAMSNVVRPYGDGRIPHNFCMNEFSARTGSRMLGKYESILSVRIRNYRILKDILKGDKRVKMQYVDNGKKSSYHLTPLRLVEMDESEVDKLFMVMADIYGIQCAKQYYPLYNYDLFSSNGHGLGKLQVRDQASIFYSQMISVPFHDGLEAEDMEYIGKSLLESLDCI